MSSSEFENIKNHMNIFVLKNTFINIYILLFNKFFYKNKKSKLFLNYRIAVQNDLNYQYGWSM